jgi:hypothetical protein
VDEPAEPVASTNRCVVLLAERNDLGRGIGRSQLERSVRPLAVVMLEVLPQDALKLAPAANEQPVETLLAQGSDEPFGVGVCVRRLDRRADDLNALRLEDLVEPSAQLRIAVMDQEAQRALAVAGVKVPLVVAALRAGVADPALMSRAITASDNQAAESLWGALGSGTTAAARVQAVLADAGDTGTTVNAVRTRPGFTPFGQTQWSLVAQQRFIADLPCIDRADTALRLMRSIESDQRWGLASTSLPAAFKGGWGPDTAGRYLVRQMGLLTMRDGRLLALSIAVVPASASFSSGTEDLTRLTKWATAHIAPRDIPATKC